MGRKELLARAGTREEKEEVVMGRRGCRASSKAGILSWWACTLHGKATAGKGHGSGATQWDVTEGGQKSRASSLTSLRLERGREKRGRHSDQTLKE